MTTITPPTPPGPRGPSGVKPMGGAVAVAAPGGRGLSERLLEPRTLAVLGLLTLGVVVLFRQWLYAQHLHSWGNGDWSHAYFVPLISVYLLWQDRERLERTPIATFWPGLIPLLMGVWCYVFFMVGVPTHLGQGLSLVLTVFGLALLVLGPRAMESLFVPIGYLAFAITVPEMIMNQVTYPLQDMAATGGFVVLTMVGVNADLSGNTITVLKGNGTPIPLNVAETCSGMRMVIAFLALGVAVALLGTRTWWKRVVLLGLAAPFAVLLNVVRVAVLGLFSLVNPNFSAGASHTLIGTLLLIPGFFLFLGILTAMNKAVPEAAVKTPKPVKRAPAVVGGGGRAARRWPAVVAGVGVLLVSAAGVSGAVKALKLHVRKAPIFAEYRCPSIPAKTPSWRQEGQDERFTEDVQGTLGTDNYLTRVYVRERGGERDVVALHLAYYTGTIDTVPHVPERCMVAGGMKQLGMPELVPVPLDASKWSEDAEATAEARAALGEPGVVVRTGLLGRTSRAPGTRVRLPRGIENLRMNVSAFEAPDGGPVQYAGYFFIANGGLAPKATDVRTLAFDLKSRYAYYMKVQVSTHGAKSAQELAALAGSLLDELLPEICECVPDWTLVLRGDYPADNPLRKDRAGGGGVGPGGAGDKSPKG